MAIKVTTTDQTTTEKTFPKLMTGGGIIYEVHPNKHPSIAGGYIGIHRTGPYAGTIVIGFDVAGLSDYNEPITLQNV